MRLCIPHYLTREWENVLYTESKEYYYLVRRAYMRLSDFINYTIITIASLFKKTSSLNEEYAVNRFRNGDTYFKSQSHHIYQPS